MSKMDSKASKSQGVVNPFYYIDGVTINPADNSNPSGTIQIKRPYAILQNATEWDLAILRATYPLNNLPLGICPLRIGLTVNSTPMSCSMTKAGSTQTTYVTWVSEFKDQPTPTSTQVQDFSSKYYWYTTVATLLSCFNTALSTCATNQSATKTPFLTFDSQSSLFSLFLPQTDFGSTASTPITLSWNSLWSQYFPNFCSTNSGGQVTLVIPTGANTQTVGGTVYWVMTQEAPNTTQWDSLSCIQMNTDLGIVPEDTATNTSAIVNSSSAVSPQITDILIDSGTGQLSGGTRSGIAEYLPVSLPRWINLRTTTFTSFNIFISWQDKYGNTYPLTLPPGTQTTMKLLFRHRSSRQGDTY